MRSGWYAFAIALIKGCSVDTALYAINTGIFKLRNSDFQEMYYLRHKENFTYQKIGLIYEMKHDAIFHCIKRYELKKRRYEDESKLCRRNACKN